MINAGYRIEVPCHEWRQPPWISTADDLSSTVAVLRHPPIDKPCPATSPAGVHTALVSSTFPARHKFPNPPFQLHVNARHPNCLLNIVWRYTKRLSLLIKYMKSEWRRRSWISAADDLSSTVAVPLLNLLRHPSTVLPPASKCSQSPSVLPVRGRPVYTLLENRALPALARSVSGRRGLTGQCDWQLIDSVDRSHHRITTVFNRSSSSSTTIQNVPKKSTPVLYTTDNSN